MSDRTRTIDEPSEQSLSSRDAASGSRAFTPTAVEEWVELSLSPATRDSYRRTVRSFRTFLGRPVIEASSADVRRWRDHMLGEGKKPGTVRHHLTVVRSLFRHLVAEGYTARNPASVVPLPKVGDDKAGRALQTKEVRWLLAGPNRATVKGARDYALLLLLARTGMRVAEVCSLTVSSMRRARGQWVLHITAKGGCERQIPLPDDIYKAIEAYLNHPGEPKKPSEAWRRRYVRADGPDAPLFQPTVNNRTGREGKALSARHVRQTVARYADLAGLKHVSPHDLRRTFITVARDLGIPNREIQMATGHKDERMIARYDRGLENLEKSAINRVTYD